MKIKKILAVLLVFVMLFSLAACGGASEDEVKGDITYNDDAIADKDDTADDEAKFELGNASGSKYENKFIGIGCNIPEGWRFYSDEEIAELNGLVLENGTEELVELLQQSDYFYDMYAVNEASTLSSINVTLEKVGTALVTKETLKQTAQASLDMVKETYKNVGYTDMEGSVGEISVGDIEFVCFELVSNFQDQFKIHQISLMTYKGGYAASIALCADSEEALDDLLKNLYVLK